jgi:hypothetical protein
VAAIALPIWINEWIKVDKYRRQRQAEAFDEAYKDAAYASWQREMVEEAEKQNERKAEIGKLIEKHLKWEKKQRETEADLRKLFEYHAPRQ